MDTEFFQAWVKSIIRMDASICFELWDATHNFIFTLMREISFQRHSFHPKKWKSLSKTLTLLSSVTLNLVTSIWKVAEFRGLLCRAWKWPQWPCQQTHCTLGDRKIKSRNPAFFYTRSGFHSRISLIKTWFSYWNLQMQQSNCSVSMLYFSIWVVNMEMIETSRRSVEGWGPQK